MSHRCGFETLESRVMLTGAADDAVLHVFSASPAVFVQNEGQWTDPAVRFAYQSQGGGVAITDQGPVFRLTQAVASSPPSDDPASQVVNQTTFSARFENSNTVVPVGADPSQTSFNYLVGDESQHRSNVAGYETIVYPGLYSGVDLQLKGNRGALKYEFHVAPGADTEQIRIAWDGIAGLLLDEEGNLHIQTELGTIIDPKPFIYQEVDGQRVEVAGRYVLDSVGDGSDGCEINGGSDHPLPRVIDPALDWSTYLGGSADDQGYSIAVDSAGNSYVTGGTYSSGLATGGSYDTTYNGGYDVFVAKLNATGTSLLYMTYLGGSGSDDHANGIAVDSTGNTYLTGGTNSSGWATAGSYDTTFNGGTSDVFVAKLNSTGTSLLYMTYLGGSSDDSGGGIAVDSAGNAYQPVA